MDETPVPKEVVNAITVTPATEPKKDSVENLVIETYEPKKSCRKCHGRGIIGYIEGDPNKPYYCTCIMKVKRELTPAQSAAYLKATAKPAEVKPEATVEQTVPADVGTTNDPQASV